MEYVCKTCGFPKPEDDFYRGLSLARKRPRLIRQVDCKKCRNRKSKQYLRDNPAVGILVRSRHFDKINGYQNDMTKEFIEQLLPNPCFYCNGKDSMMTIDRKNSEVGHVQNNVNPCCLPCNIIKRDMPYDMWLLLVPGIKAARELGLFQQWNTKFGRSGKKLTDFVSPTH